MACRAVGNGTDGGSRDQNPAVLMLNSIQLETGGIGKEGLDMARGRSHLPLTIEHFFHSMFRGHFGRSPLHGNCGRTQFRVANSTGELEGKSDGVFKGKTLGEICQADRKRDPLSQVQARGLKRSNVFKGFRRPERRRRSKL